MIGGDRTSLVGERGAIVFCAEFILALEERTSSIETRKGQNKE
jgi:hypothetical protein